MTSKNNLRRLVLCAMIAAAYAVASLAIPALSFNGLQMRVGEALTLLPVLFPEAIFGVTLGCFVTNAIGLMSGADMLPLDLVIGTTATLLAAIATYKLRNVRWKGLPLLSALMPVIFNAIIIGAELAFVLSESGFSFEIFLIQGALVGLGELVACFVLGIPLVLAFEKRNIKLD